MLSKLPKLSNGGYALVIVLIFLAVSVILPLALFLRVGGFVFQTRTSIAREQATHLSEAGIDYAIWELNKNPSSEPTTLAVPLGTGGAFQLSLTPPGSTRTITSKGCIPDCNNARYTRKIKVEVTNDAISIPFDYAVHAGTGGINFTAAADTTSIGGKAYSNGNITCAGSTGNCRIDGDAWMSALPGPIPVTPTIGYIRAVGAPIMPFPTIDEVHWQNAASCNNNPNCIQDCPGNPPTCTLSGVGTFNLIPGRDVGPYNCCQFNGNLQIIGAVTHVGGAVYIKSVTGATPAQGSLTLSGGGGMVPDGFTLGSCGTVILTDGPITIEASSNVGSAGLPPSYLLLETTTTNNPAISVTKNLTSNAGIFYAKNGKLVFSRIGSSFNSESGAFLGQTVQLGRSTNLVYGSNIPAIKFCGSGNKWPIKRGTYRFAD